jgi:hypothetical protein
MYALWGGDHHWAAGVNEGGKLVPHMCRRMVLPLEILGALPLYNI